MAYWLFVGQFLRSFGGYGSSKGEFDCLAGIAVNKYKQFVITDRYNHRVQIFDSSGRFLREFGAHGQTNGRFNNPWGIVVDSQGFIYVCDKDNHRVQMFQVKLRVFEKLGVSIFSAATKGKAAVTKGKAHKLLRLF